MKRILSAILGIIGVGLLLLWLIPWLDNGGWPASGPTGMALPPQIQYVAPRDGDTVPENHGFCVHFDFQAGAHMDEGARGSIQYFLDGWNVTGQMHDLISLEYPTQVAEPCFKQVEPLRAGWHTAKVSYADTSGVLYEYSWRFQVVVE